MLAKFVNAEAWFFISPGNFLALPISHRAQSWVGNVQELQIPLIDRSLWHMNRLLHASHDLGLFKTGLGGRGKCQSFILRLFYVHHCLLEKAGTMIIASPLRGPRQFYLSYPIFIREFCQIILPYRCRHMRAKLCRMQLIITNLLILWCKWCFAQSCLDFLSVGWCLLPATEFLIRHDDRLNLTSFRALSNWILWLHHNNNMI